MLLNLHYQLFMKGKQNTNVKDVENHIQPKLLMNLFEHLDRHIKSTHDKIKNNKCNLCDQSFFALSDLKRQIAMVHNGEKEFKCDICQKLFPSKFNANRHIKEVHEGKKY